jgi:hypothetical protein
MRAGATETSMMQCDTKQTNRATASLINTFTEGYYSRLKLDSIHSLANPPPAQDDLGSLQRDVTVDPRKEELPNQVQEKAILRDKLANSLGFVTESQLAVLADVKITTVEDWRKRGNGPSFTRFGMSHLYSLNDVKEHLSSLAKGRSKKSIIDSI